ncbi:hypothetical protein XH81_04010 [Bradyrhizobium sp. CCBAU 25360]|uniref:hypothetical protein n=1 Tax=Bradyrhizobium sp. CCBAU 25360 TaxID=858425 RepID=UPI002306AF02|nr:hypothetical protein [Bradyrhizobium sp. CCBAU 25360]MDA9414034.1 hypothetical protein [Bradyrhizobium sp. CCBAU 25360]
MLRFYDHWLDDGELPLVALAKAQTWLTRSSRADKCAYLQSKRQANDALVVPDNVKTTASAHYRSLESELRQTNALEEQVANLVTASTFFITGF